jgi:hypothetical protein
MNPACSNRQKWADIKARMKPATRARLEAGARELAEEMRLSQLPNAEPEE